MWKGGRGEKREEKREDEGLCGWGGAMLGIE
jgi:hypothetical protein